MHPGSDPQLLRLDVDLQPVQRSYGLRLLLGRHSVGLHSLFDLRRGLRGLTFSLAPISHRGEYFTTLMRITLFILGVLVIAGTLYALATWNAQPKAGIVHALAAEAAREPNPVLADLVAPPASDSPPPVRLDVPVASAPVETQEEEINNEFRQTELAALWEVKYDGMTPSQLLAEYNLLRSHLSNALSDAALDMHRRGLSSVAPLDKDGAATSRSSEDRLVGVYIGENSVAYNVELNRDNARDILELRDETVWVQARARSLAAQAEQGK